MHFKNVLSCFDGISCGQLALVRAGHTYDNYYASEVDKYAIKITLKNFPQTIQLGDIKSVWSRNLPPIDLIMGGSPCQDLSIAGKRAGLGGERSGLFWHFVRLVRTCKPKYFLLENVASMTKENRDIMSEALGVEPILINSALVSAQERKRLYWTNISGITQPQDRNIFWDNILINDVEEKYFFSDRTYIGMQKIKERSDAQGLGFRTEPIQGKVKFKGLDANYHKGCDGKRSMISSNNKIRMATPIECERLQTLPDNYTGLGKSYYYYNIYDIINMVIKGEQLCKNVKLKDAKILSQTEKQDYAINIIYDISDMEQQNLQEILLNEKKSVLLMDAITSNKQERDIVLNTIRDIKEQVQQNLIKMNLKNVNIAIDWQLQEECVIGTIKIGYDTEMQNIQIKLEKEQIITDIKNIKENIEYNIEKLLQKYWGEIYHLKKLYTILIWINLIMIKKIYMCVIKMNTQAYISSLIELQGNSLKLELSNLKMVDIIPISSTQRYKAIGNGWTVDVIAHIFSFIKE